MKDVPAQTVSLTPWAFEEFYRAHRDAVARALVLTLGDRDLGSDAADEAMARAYQHWRRISHYDNPAAWAYRVGLNWARSFLRRRRAVAGIYAAESGIVDPPGADPALDRALASLDTPQRAVVVLRLYLDWSVEATADALRIAPGTVKSRLSRALRRLQVLLEETP